MGAINYAATGLAPGGPEKVSSITPKLILLALSVGVSFAFLEAALRIVDPLPARVRGNTLRLSTNIKVVFENTGIPRMDPKIVVTRNSLGFRGPEMPPDYARKLSVLTVGGSTTECHYISDGGTWPDLLAGRLSTSIPDLWLNNAGLDGHSTFGHSYLLRQVVIPLKPKVVIFLIGINDVGRTTTSISDQALEDCTRCSLGRKLFSLIVENSEVAGTALNLHRAWRAGRRGLTHRVVDLRNSPRKDHVSTPAEITLLHHQHEHALEGYRQRVQRLVGLCRSNGIVPILITQPALFGSGREPVTGIQLDTVVSTDDGLDGLTAWTVLEWYNDVVRETGKAQHVAVVDLAHELPKNFDYFYDFIHYTNKGAAAVAEIVACDLGPYLRKLPR